MSVQTAYQYLYGGALIWFAILCSAMLIRSIIGPRITDRILAINMIGTMVICSILILSRMVSESYLIDVALIYAMVSFISVLILATIYIPVGKKRGRFEAEVREEVLKEREALREEESA